jgi:hypothetical protein
VPCRQSEYLAQVQIPIEQIWMQIRGIEHASVAREALSRGNRLYGARDDGLLVRLGTGADARNLKLDGLEPMIFREGQMQRRVRAALLVHGDNVLRRKLVDSAMNFVPSLPPE